MLHAAQPTMVHLVHRPHVRPAAIDDAAADMVLQVFPHAGQFVQHFDAGLLRGGDEGVVQRGKQRVARGGQTA